MYTINQPRAYRKRNRDKIENFNEPVTDMREVEVDASDLRKTILRLQKENRELKDPFAMRFPSLEEYLASQPGFQTMYNPRQIFQLPRFDDGKIPEDTSYSGQDDLAFKYAATPTTNPDYEGDFANAKNWLTTKWLPFTRQRDIANIQMQNPENIVAVALKDYSDYDYGFTNGIRSSLHGRRLRKAYDDYMSKHPNASVGAQLYNLSNWLDYGGGRKAYYSNKNYQKALDSLNGLLYTAKTNYAQRQYNDTIDHINARYDRAINDINNAILIKRSDPEETYLRFGLNRPMLEKKLSPWTGGFTIRDSSKDVQWLYGVSPEEQKKQEDIAKAVSLTPPVFFNDDPNKKYKNVAGSYTGKGSPYSTMIHELTHIAQKNLGPYYSDISVNPDDHEYMTRNIEKDARLRQAQRAYNISPSKMWTMDEVKQLREQYADDEFAIFKYMDDEQLMNFLNGNYD